jgi:hypothetical protein
MAEVYMYIYNWQEKKEENQALEDFCHAPSNNTVSSLLLHCSGGLRPPPIALAIVQLRTGNGMSVSDGQTKTAF